MLLTVNASSTIASGDPNAIGRLIGTWIKLAYGDPREFADGQEDWAKVDDTPSDLLDDLLGDFRDDLGHQHWRHRATGIETLFTSEGDAIVHLAGEQGFSLSNAKGIHAKSGWYHVIR